MLKLTAYKGKDIQNTKILVEGVLKEEGNITVKEILNLLEREIKTRFKNYTEQEEVNKNNAVPAKVCPSCGKGHLSPIMNYEGLPILACRKCRYSYISEIEEKEEF